VICNGGWVLKIKKPAGNRGAQNGVYKSFYNGFKKVFISWREIKNPLEFVVAPRLPAGFANNFIGYIIACYCINSLLFYCFVLLDSSAWTTHPWTEASFLRRETCKTL